MKNLKLLLATTAMLSMGAMVANAEPAHTPETATVTVYSKAYLVNPLTLVSDSDNALVFGSLRFEKGKKIKVDAYGNIDENETTAQYLSTGDQQAAKITLSGGIWGTYGAGVNASGTTADWTDEDFDELDQDFEPFMSWSIPTIELKYGNTKCGDVVIDSKRSRDNANGYDFYLGGTFTMTTQDIAVPATGMLCEGNVTATAVFTFPYGG